jgi:hypothetical protein
VLLLLFDAGRKLTAAANPTAAAAADSASQTFGGLAVPTSSRRLLAGFTVDGACLSNGNNLFSADWVLVNEVISSVPATCSGNRPCGNANSPNVSQALCTS